MTINWNRRKYTEEQFINAWKNSASVTECARKLSLNIFGSTAQTLNSTAQELGLTKEHMTGRGHLKGKTHNWTPARSDDEVFIHNKKENNNQLKIRLFRKGWAHQCHSCKNTEWMGGKIPLELEHIDGDNTNNALENLKLLCPNCHALTPTWRGKNVKRV